MRREFVGKMSEIPEKGDWFVTLHLPHGTVLMFAGLPWWTWPFRILAAASLGVLASAAEGVWTGHCEGATDPTDSETEPSATP